MHDCEFCGNEIDYHEIIDCITCALDARDPYTAGHSERVSDMALKVCQLIGLKKEDTLKIHIAAHLHDIGKIGVPDAVLNKEGKLTDEEFAYIKKHPIIGAEILGKSHKLSELSDIVLMPLHLTAVIVKHMILITVIRKSRRIWERCMTRLWVDMCLITGMR